MLYVYGGSSEFRIDSDWFGHGKGISFRGRSGGIFEVLPPLSFIDLLCAFSCNVQDSVSGVQKAGANVGSSSVGIAVLILGTLFTDHDTGVSLLDGTVPSYSK